MLTIFVPAEEEWNEVHEEFVQRPATQVHMEHSLVSLSQWESKYHRPYISQEPMTPEETLDYISMMILDTDLDPTVLLRLTAQNFKEINDYIDDPQTATWFTENNGSGPGKRGGVVTSEIIYYWMVTLNIPFECQYWHLNRLLTLVRVCNEKNQPPKKMSKKELMSRNRALNAARRKKLHTKG